MTRKSPTARRKGSARCDPMSDTWLALIGHAGAIISRLDPATGFWVSRRTRPTSRNEARRAEDRLQPPPFSRE